MYYGLNSSQDIFQKRMDQTVETCRGATPIAGDIQVFGTDDNHDMHLHEVVERIRSAGIKLNFEKCVIKLKSWTFFGNVHTPQGVKPDLKKVEVIKKMEAPQTKQELTILLWHGKHIQVRCRGMSPTGRQPWKAETSSIYIQEPYPS